MPVRIFGADEAVDADGRRLQLLLAQQGQRIDELAIGLHEAQRADHDQRHPHQRQHDQPEDLEPVAAVDQRGLLELERHLPEHRPQDHQRERQRLRGGRQDHGGEGVQHVEGAEDDEDRRRQQRLGKDLQHQHRDQGDVDQPGAQPAHRIGAHRARGPASAP